MTVTTDRPQPAPVTQPGVLGSAERNALIEDFLGLAYGLADRYASPGTSRLSREDLRQIAAEALTKAADRYDPRRGTFAAYARPFVSGAIKRSFRDHSWAVRPPRDLQERALHLSAITEDLAQQVGRAPTPSELAEAMGCTRDEVIEAIDCGATFTATSLDAVIAPDRLIQNTIPAEATEKVDDLISLAPLIAALPERDRLMLSLRFGSEMTQTQIAQKLGVSQMQISRRLSACMAKLRRGLLPENA